jgi:hypothetical protein
LLYLEGGKVPSWYHNNKTIKNDKEARRRSGGVFVAPSSVIFDDDLSGR